VINRRAFISSVTLGLLAAPLAGNAQRPTKIPRVGLLSPSSVSDPRTVRYFQALRQGLRDAGYVEDQSIVIESRWAEGKYNRLAALAAELVRLEIAVIVTYGGAAIEATRRATGTVPIVMAVVQEVESTGLVSSLAHPGGNITGTSSMAPELVQKQLQILREVVPKVSRIALLGNPVQPGHGPQVRYATDAARELGVSVRVLEARDPIEIDKAFTVMTAEQTSAVIVLPDSMLLDHRTEIDNRAIQGRLPMVSAIGDHAEAGGLPQLWLFDRHPPSARPQPRAFLPGGDLPRSSETGGPSSTRP
jgi:putative ABC transport system substrate-binding protein